MIMLFSRQKYLVFCCFITTISKVRCSIGCYYFHPRPYDKHIVLAPVWPKIASAFGSGNFRVEMYEN